MIRRTLMQRNRELADFEVDPVTGAARIVDAADGDPLVSAGLTRQDGNWLLAKLVERRALSPLRKDKGDILAAFGAKSPAHLALMGHGLSLTDQFWYRAPGGVERWEDINFLDNGWDPAFGTAVLSGDYARLAACSPDVPESTTSGHAVKAWERDGGVRLVKAAERPDGAELAGAKLASEMCGLLFDEGRYAPLDVVERYGRPCSTSPLMLGPGEELVDGNRLCAMAGMQESPGLSGGGVTAEACDSCIGVYAALGIAGASAHVAGIACISCLSLFLDFNPSNFGAIRSVGSDEWRPAPIFDHDGAFGFPFKGVSISYLCENPLFVELLCAQRFSFLKPSWDWSWFDPRALEGFEERIVEAFAPYRSLPPNFAEIISHLFVIQREYVNAIASGKRA